MGRYLISCKYYDKISKQECRISCIEESDDSYNIMKLINGFLTLNNRTPIPITPLQVIIEPVNGEEICEVCNKIIYPIEGHHKVKEDGTTFCNSCAIEQENFDRIEKVYNYDE